MRRGAPIGLGALHAWRCPGRAPLAAGAPPGGAAQSASGAGTCPAGIRIARGGRGTCAAGSGIRFVSLPDWPDRLNACALTIPCAGALPLGLSPSPRGRSEATCIKPGTGCTAPQHGVCHPIPRPHHYATRATFSGPRFVSQKCACATVPSMKEIPVFTYYALLALSGMGLIQAAYLLFFADKDEKNGGPSPFSRPEAPEGYRWVLMLEEEAEAREQQRTA